MNRKVTWLIAPLALLALTSCVGGEAGEATGNDSKQNSGYTDITDQQGSVDDFIGALDDATVERCEAAGDGWIAAGEVTNPAEDAQSYRIYVAFMDNSNTEGLVQVDIESVAANGTATWEAEAPIGGDDLRCTLRVERFAPQS